MILDAIIWLVVIVVSGLAIYLLGVVNQKVNSIYDEPEVNNKYDDDDDFIKYILARYSDEEAKTLIDAYLKNIKEIPDEESIKTK